MRPAIVSGQLVHLVCKSAHRPADVRATPDRRKYVAEAVSRGDRVVLSRELSAFLIEFSIALHKHAIYPVGHPSLEPAAARVTERAERLLEDRPTLAFGVARYQLIIDGVATDPNQPVLRRLAETLHRHHLGAMSILSGVEIGEIGGALDALASEVGPEVQPLGLAPAGRLPDWPHVRLHPLTLERLELIDDAAPADGSGGQVAGRAHSSGSAWRALRWRPIRPRPRRLRPSPQLSPGRSTTTPARSVTTKS